MNTSNQSKTKTHSLSRPEFMPKVLLDLPWQKGEKDLDDDLYILAAVLVREKVFVKDKPEYRFYYDLAAVTTNDGDLELNGDSWGWSTAALDAFVLLGR